MVIFSIILAVVVAQAIGMFWYSPKGFGKKWMELSGACVNADPVEGKKGMIRSVVISSVINIITVLALIWMTGFVDAYLNLNSVKEFGFLQAREMGLIDMILVLPVWLGLAFPIYCSAALWEGKKWQLVAINASYGLVSLVAMYLVLIFLN